MGLFGEISYTISVINPVGPCLVRMVQNHRNVEVVNRNFHLNEKTYFKDHWLRHKRCNDPNSSLALKGGELHAPALSSMSFTDYLSKCIYFWQRINPGMFSIENKRQEEAQQERNPYIPSPSPSSS